MATWEYFCPVGGILENAEASSEPRNEFIAKPNDFINDKMSNKETSGQPCLLCKPN